MPTETTRIIADRYRLLDPLGRGGMGVVWAAEDSILQRRVAVKEVETPGGLSEAERDALEARVMREARAAARLNHPNVVTVYDVVEDEGRTFIVMELVEAPSLADVVSNEGPLEPERAARIVLDVLAALEAAHAEGIVHRDVKPANVMISASGSTKLGDFGIASVKGDPKITSTGLILGSPSYMAPEQATHGTSGPEADLWALGALLYFALEGEPPFDKGQALPTLAAVVGEPARPMERGGALSDLVDRLLTKEPQGRPGPRDIRAALEPIASGNASSQVVTTPARPPSTPVATAPATPVPVPDTPRPQPARTGRSTLPWVAAVVVVLLAGAALWALANRDPASPDRAERRSNRAGADNDRAQDADEGARDAGAVDTSGWASYRDEATGYELRYPPEWTPSTVDETRTDFVDPASGTYLRVDWTDQPGDDPVAAWESFEEDFAASHEGYERVSLEPTTYKGMDAAWWEFTYSDGGSRLHAVDLGFVTDSGTYGFALNFQTQEADWEESADLFKALQESFRVPS